MADAATVTVAPIAAADHEAWKELWRAYHAFYEASVEPEMYDLAFERMLSGAPGEFRGFLARDVGGAPVGLTHYLFHRNGWLRNAVCYLQDLYVTPEARGLGAGRRLIEAVYAAADQEGAVSVYWLTQHFNAPARALYDKIAVETPFIKYARPS